MMASMGMHWRGEEEGTPIWKRVGNRRPPPSRAPSLWPSHCLPVRKCQLQWHL